MSAGAGGSSTPRAAMGQGHSRLRSAAVEGKRRVVSDGCRDRDALRPDGGTAGRRLGAPSSHVGGLRAQLDRASGQRG